MTEAEANPINSGNGAAAASAENASSVKPPNIQKALREPDPRDALSGVANAEKPRDDKNKVIARLHQIRSVVGTALQEQRRGNESHVFYQTAERVMNLGESYTQYLEKHMNDPDMDEKVFTRIAQLAKTSFLMNLEQYRNAITSRDPKNKFIADYLTAHQDLAALDPAGNEGPWKNYREPLYYSSNNDVREAYREAIAANARELIASNDLTLQDLDHLERFLVDPQGRLPKDFIPEYVAAHRGEIERWTPSSLQEFQSFILDNIRDFQGDLSSNEFLKRLDEEIASIKPEHGVKYRDRQAKVTFLRSLRFGRVTKDDLIEITKPKQVDLSERPDLAKTLAPILRGGWKEFKLLIDSTRGESPETRKAKLIEALNKPSVPSDTKEKALAYIETNL